MNRILVIMGIIIFVIAIVQAYNPKFVARTFRKYTRHSVRNFSLIALPGGIFIGAGMMMKGLLPKIAQNGVHFLLYTGIVCILISTFAFRTKSYIR